MIDNYPLGANTSNAPWNETDIPKHNFDICVSQTISKNIQISTNDYKPNEEHDEDGWYNCPDTSDTDWCKAYKNSNHYTPLELIQILRDLLLKHLPDPIIDIKEFREVQELVKECEGWAEDELILTE